MKRSEKRILTTHVGSLVRPPELRKLAQSGQDRPEDAAPTAGYIETLRRTRMQTSANYVARMVLIDSDIELREGPPVQTRVFDIAKVTE